MLKSGEIQSKEGQFVVRVLKSGQAGVDFSQLTKYGLPIYIAVANGSSKSISFGPQHIKVYKNDRAVEQLTAYGIQQKLEKKNISNKIFTGLSSAYLMILAVAGVSSQADPQLQTSLLEQTKDRLDTTFGAYDKQKSFNAEVGSSLAEKILSTSLPNGLLAPQSANAGHVYFEGVKAADAIRIEVSTGEVKHVIHYK